jgi:MFS family permease
LTGAAIDDGGTASLAGGSRLFWRFWTASTVSDAGTAMTAVAMPLLAVLVLHASTLRVSVLTAATYIAWLLIGLPAGVIVSRLPLRGAQVAMDAIRAAAVASVPLAAAVHALTFAQLVAVAVIVGLASVIFDVGNSTFLPAIVSPDELTRRNSLTTGSSAAVQLGGPSLGGLLVQLVGAPACLLVDAVSYGVSAVVLRALPRPPRAAAPDGPAPSMAALIRDGWRFVVRHQVIRPCVSAATLVNMCAGALTAITPVYLVRSLGASAGLVGLVIAADGVGSIAGAAVASRAGARLGSARAVFAAGACSGLSVLLLPLASRGWGLLVFAAGNIGFAAGVTVLSILTRTHRQTASPPDLLPRVMATVRFVSWGAIPVGALAVGVLAASFGNHAALWAACVPAFLTPFALWFSTVRRHRDLA